MAEKAHQVAALLHQVNWEVPEVNEYSIEEGIALCRAEGSCIQNLYNDLCGKTTIDGGEPLGHLGTYLRINVSGGRFVYDFWGHHSLVSRICNVISICTGIPATSCIVFASDDGFETTFYTESIYQFTQFQESIVFGNGSQDSSITPSILEEIKVSWRTEKGVYDKGERHMGAVGNALIHFFYAWRSGYHEQACIHLAVVLEALLGPNATTELSHRLAFNASRFFRSDPEGRREIYRLVRAFYVLRSKIVHGGEPDWKDLDELTPRIYSLCGEALKRILLDAALAAQFNCSTSRERLFTRWLFE